MKKTFLISSEVTPAQAVGARRGFFAVTANATVFSSLSALYQVRR